MSVAVSNQINIHKAPVWSRDKKIHPKKAQIIVKIPSMKEHIMKRVFWVFIGSFFCQ